MRSYGREWNDKSMLSLKMYVTPRIYRNKEVLGHHLGSDSGGNAQDPFHLFTLRNNDNKSIASSLRLSAYLLPMTDFKSLQTYLSRFCFNFSLLQSIHPTSCLQGNL